MMPALHSSLTFLLLSSLLKHALGQTPLTLPQADGVMTLVTGLVDPNGDGQVEVRLPKSSANKLVVLNRMEGSVYVPVGRSYDGFDWERTAGPEVGLEWECAASVCDVSLPFEAGKQTYYLTTYDHTLSDRATVARFLEKAAFGPTMSDLVNWDYSGGDLEISITEWVEDQILNKGTSSHREYFRKRLNPRSIESYKYGISGPKPCEENSRWRKFAFTRKDLWLSQRDYFNVEIEVETNGDDTTWILKFAGHVRTLLDQPLEIYGLEANFTLVDKAIGVGSYKICHLDEIVGDLRLSNSDHLRSFGLEIDDVCRYVVRGKSEFMEDCT